jgi:hypothetical protein
MVNASKEAATLLTISLISSPVTVIIRNITEPAGVEPPPVTWRVLGNYVQIIVDKSDVTVNATIRFYYTLKQLQDAGVDENTLKIHFWNTTLGQWMPVESHVNADEHYVWAIVDHFSLWVIMGQEPPSPTTPLWLWFTMVVFATATIATTTLYIKKRNNRTH